MNYKFIPHDYDKITGASEMMVSVWREKDFPTYIGDQEIPAFGVVYGFSDLLGKEIIPCIYDDVGWFSDGLAAVTKNYSGRWGYIDKTGKSVISPKYHIACSFNDGLAVVGIGKKKVFNIRDVHGDSDYNLDGKWGCIDKTGCEIVPFGKYTIIGDYHSNSFSLGPQTFNGSFTYNREYCQGRVSVCDHKTGKYGFIDTLGNETVPLIYDSVRKYSNGMARVCRGDEKTGKWGFVSDNGHNLIPCRYDYVDDFSEGFALCTEVRNKPALRMAFDGVVEESKYSHHYYLDINGNVSISIICEYARSFSNGMAAIYCGNENSGKFGFIDNLGNKVVPCIYESVSDFIEDFACVTINKKWADKKYGFINKNGDEIVPCKYDFAQDFCEGLAVVRNGSWEEGNYGFIDKTGNEIIPCIYDNAEDFSEGLAAVCSKDKKWGFIDKTGKEVIPCIYSEVTGFCHGWASVSIWGGGKKSRGYISVS